MLTNVGAQIQLLAPHTFEVLDTLEDMLLEPNGVVSEHVLEQLAEPLLGLRVQPRPNQRPHLVRGLVS